jgi:hypothetical protein
MSKRDRGHDKGRLPQFVPLLTDTLKSPAWLATSHGARSLYVALRGRVFVKDSSNNNGRAFVSVRDACAEIRSSHEQVVRWFEELQHFGFILMTMAGCLGTDGHGRAPHWRLTELGSRSADGAMEPPTRDFLRWTGQRFRPLPMPPRQKSESRCGKPRTSARKTATPALRKTATLNGQSVAENRNIENDPKCAENRNIASNHLHGEERSRVVGRSEGLISRTPRRKPELAARTNEWQPHQQRAKDLEP